jgi:hypothetical protein
MAVALTRDVPVAAGVTLLAGTRGVVDLECSRARHGRRYVVRFGDIQAIVFRGDIAPAVADDRLPARAAGARHADPSPPAGYHREQGR